MTPFLDSCFGAGKTSLAFKFRNNLSTRCNELPEYEPLRQAIYLHVSCTEDSQLPHMRDLQDVQTFDDCALRLLKSILELSCKNELELDTGDVHKFRLYLAQVCNNTRFIFHFDDVGVYETYGDNIAMRMLYRIWHIGDALKQCGHFFIMSGRSRFLHLIGNSTRQSGAFSSPNIALMIPLPLLSDVAVRSIIKDAGALPVLTENNLQFICTLCSGVPRAVSGVLTYLASHSTGQPISLKLLENAVSLHCIRNSAFGEEDAQLFIRCLELSWAEIYLPDSASVCDTPLTSAIARLGIFTEHHPEDPHLLRLKVPNYLSRAHNPSIRSIVAIAQYDDAGSRLECGFRRVFHLRFSLSPQSWDAAGLPFLGACRVPFPTVPYASTYPFPKITPGRPRSEREINEIMTAVHSGETCVSRVEYPQCCAASIAHLMRVGQYYLSLPKSSSADAKIKLSSQSMLDLQFKNYRKPVTRALVDSEVLKSRMPGWEVYLVIVCPEGYETPGDIYEVKEHVHCLVLSKHSVETFIGNRATSGIKGNTLLANASARVFASPAPQLAGAGSAISSSSSDAFTVRSLAGELENFTIDDSPGIKADRQTDRLDHSANHSSSGRIVDRFTTGSGYVRKQVKVPAAIPAATAVGNTSSREAKVREGAQKTGAPDGNTSYRCNTGLTPSGASISTGATARRAQTAESALATTSVNSGISTRSR